MKKYWYEVFLIKTFYEGTEIPLIHVSVQQIMITYLLCFKHRLLFSWCLHFQLGAQAINNIPKYVRRWYVL